MQRVMVVGAGNGGVALLRMLYKTKMMNIIAVVDISEKAPGIALAKELGIHTSTDWKHILCEEIDIVIEATNNQNVFQEIMKEKNEHTIVIPGTIAHIMSDLINEKEALILKLKEETYKQETIFNSTNDGMIGIDVEENIILFNKTAEKITGFERKKALGERIDTIIPSSLLPNTLKTREVEINQEQILDNGLKIITSRIPIVDDSGRLLGAMSIFKDITDVVSLAEEVTDLKEIKTMFEAIIQSSEEAISVVDEEGCGILINKAYTKMTGLTEGQVIGKPATADISEGESVHMQVLETRRPVRGVSMKVGPNKKDVIVNVAPVIVDGILKGSVGVIQDMSEIRTLTNELDRARQIIRTLEAKYTFTDIIGNSEEMKLAIDQAKLGAKTPATVLLRGESGTGKELFAHAIHSDSDRKFNKFVRVNCAAISENLLESELFGYEDGAFSGAKRGGKRGFFEEANNGSIFLDEIGELSPQMQVKLLRVLQEREIIRVGGTTPIPINVRVIAATNVNIEKAMSEGYFREDLYYRLNRYPISIPPLRDRKGDIDLLSAHIIRKFNQEYGRNINGISVQALAVLKQYDWPGNVRELENILGRAIIFMGYHEAEIGENHIPPLDIQAASHYKQLNMRNKEEKLADTIERIEAEIISSTLEQQEYNRTKTAQVLGVSLRNLYYKMEKYNLANNSMQ
ncbi:sigma 54-interacting transcriptional regulator [Metabacillus fastidiosus]|uniref:Sigma 54-interacting transcriptional regulator n=1 Tax=Metabacillus fastidiosus TaxID=1458 RepID=A0ABU6NW53_9BACI|nr:sigma-54-dependent Fis family transcriptional regulator [Metabacillus fastidiosus]MED4400858.1 sigma 54-interacting transcriptional regulator [Metabacillus fastidiosus]MED4453564.1 sigma 54-interacting transcriptional regulator [Metabacillus fastidiosus]MED4463785.1 sigma 54-interacting transcriptional regulator [Metabacillus fastidiosus]